MNYREYIVVDKDGNPVKPSFKERFSKGFKKTIKWVEDNKEVVIVAVPVIAGAIGFTTRAIVKRSNLNKQEHVKENFCYDPSLGHYWELRRKLSNKEWLEIDARKKNGERLAEILESLKVLK